MPQFIIIYRPSGALECETAFIGPFLSFEAAYNRLCELPAIGGGDGVKYIAELTT